VEGSGHGLIWGTTPAFALSDWRNTTNSLSVATAPLKFKPITSKIYAKKRYDLRQFAVYSAAVTFIISWMFASYVCGLYNDNCQ
jgi:hypothetical protein